MGVPCAVGVRVMSYLCCRANDVTMCVADSSALLLSARVTTAVAMTMVFNSIARVAVALGALQCGMASCWRRSHGGPPFIPGRSLDVEHWLVGAVAPQTDEDGQVEGEDTPPEDEGLLDPIEDAVDTLERQWDAGLEELVYLLAEHILGIVQRPRVAQTRRVRWLGRVCESFRARPPAQGSLPPGWRQWLQRLREAVEVNEEDEVAFMQRKANPGEGLRRSDQWRRHLQEAKDYPRRVRGRILYRLRMWLRRRVTNEGCAVQVLGSMLCDLESVVLAPDCSAEEAMVADEVAERMVGELETAFQAGELQELPELVLGPAMESLAMELARRADRCRAGEVVPVEAEGGMSTAEEESEVGLRLTQWVRVQLQNVSNAEDRSTVVRLVLQGLRQQLEEEARHLRRLYMGTIAVSTMASGQSAGDAGDTPQALQCKTKELIDTIIMHMASVPLPECSVLDMLREGHRSRATSSGDSWPRELELLRQWMNDYVEATVRAVQDDEDLINVCTYTETGDQEEDLEEEDLATTDQEADNLEFEGDETAMVQGSKPPWRETSRERSRSPTTRRPASGPGGRERAGGDDRRGDGNDHRPWRREWTRPSSSRGLGGEGRSSATRGGTGRTLAPRGIPKAMPRGGGTDPAASIRALPEGWLQHAWHCVLDMAEPTTPPQTYSYGITGDAQNNLEATMLDMDAPARMTMMLEFLRVMSMILWDVATTIQRALDQADTVEVVPEQDDEDTAMVQTEAKLKQKHKPKSTAGEKPTSKPGKSPGQGPEADQISARQQEKGDRLRRSAAKGSLESTVVSQKLDSLMKTLRAAMDHMKTQEARACSQAFLQRLLIFYYGFVTEDLQPGLPPDAEMVLASFVGYGAGLGQEGEALTPQDNYFVGHWWDMIQPLLPALQTQSAAPATEHHATAAGITTGPAVIVDPTQSTIPATSTGSGNMAVTGTALGAAWERLLASAIPTQELEVVEDESPSVQVGRTEEPNGDNEHEGKDDERMENVHDEVIQGENQRQQGPEVTERDTIAEEDLIQAAVQMEAAVYQDWEDWLLREAMSRGPLPGSRCRVIGQVFENGRAISPRQSFDFQLDGNRELRISMQIHAPQHSGAVEGSTVGHPPAQGSEGTSTEVTRLEGQGRVRDGR